MGPIQIYASLNELKAQGWFQVHDIEATKTWPESGSIFMAKDSCVLQHIYNVYDGTTDYPNDDQVACWNPVKIYTETRRYVRDDPNPKNIPFDETDAKAHRIAREARERAVRIKQQDDEERSLYERLHKKFGS